LRPEHAWTAELGVDAEIAGRLWLAVAAYRRQAEDLIDWARPIGGDGPWETRNVETATFRGLEGELTGLRLAGTEITLRGALLDISADSAAGFTSKYALRPIVNDASLRLARALGLVGVETRVNFRRREGESGYWLWDLRLTAPMRFGEFLLDVLNALDADYADISGAVAPGRSIMIGFRARM
jgi:outer membrane cobalamin receptor